ncbi:hypothetical protein PO124_29035 [Bacillus licheniformis]|nr:hypothetical protein [Bacillus licheniformis]
MMAVGDYPVFRSWNQNKPLVQRNSKLNVIEAERLKAEVHLAIERMEEDQDLLSYYQLMNLDMS